MSLADAEDSPPMQRAFDERAATLPPPPPPRPTLQMPAAKVAELDAAMVVHERERAAEVLNTLHAALPNLATKADVAQVGGGVRMAIAAGEGAAAAVDRLRADLSLWLFGEQGPNAQLIRTGLVHHVAAASELGKSALDAASRANDTANRALAFAVEARRLAATDDSEHGHNGAG